MNDRNDCVRLIALLGLAAAAAPLAAQPDVKVVAAAPGPGIDHTSIQAAVDASSNGDVILVMPGDYGPVLIDGRAISIHADIAGTVRVLASPPPGLPPPSSLSPLLVRNLAPSASVSVRGLSLDASATTQIIALDLRDNAGPVSIENCLIVGGKAFVFGGAGAHAARVQDSALAIFADCDLVGADGTDGDDFFDGGNGGNGLLASVSTIALYRSRLRAGVAGDEPILLPAHGGHGAELEGGVLFASGTTFRGGAQGDGSDGHPGFPGYGVKLTHVTAQFVECTLTGGAGTPSGAVLYALFSPFAFFFGPHRSLELASPLREGQSASIDVKGAPGEVAFLAASSGIAYASLSPLVLGPLLLEAPYTLVPLGVVPAGGSLSLPFTVQELGPGVEGVSISVQAFFASAAGALFLGEPSTTLLLDASL